MNAAVLPLTLVVTIPVMGMFAAGWGAARGFSRLLALTVLLGSVLVGGSLLVAGVQAACTINESECIGATVTAKLVALLWLVAFAVAAIFVRRTNAPNAR
jgi:hypothetical protein